MTVHLAAAPDARSWSALVSLLCGAVRGGLPGVPPLLLVALQADRATSLAVCRRCCVGQVRACGGEGGGVCGRVWEGVGVGVGVGVRVGVRAGQGRGWGGVLQPRPRTPRPQSAEEVWR